MARENLKNSTFLLLGMRALAEKIKSDPDNQTPDAVQFADYFTELDRNISEEMDIPRDWIPF